MSLMNDFLLRIKKIRNLFRILDHVRMAMGRIESRQCAQIKSMDLLTHEFSVYSQDGEDGIIQFLVRLIPVPRPVFIEFGVQDYLEANTRFLLMNNRWSGLVLDCLQKNVDFIRNDSVSFMHALEAKCAFVDRDNINQLLKESGITGDMGLLSIDIDGNDYWVWEAVDCISPRIVICEYNSLFGPTRRVTIPYDAAFMRTRAHFSNIYYGASIAALTTLGKKKGYSLIGSNSLGNNLFFVRNDVLGDLKPLDPASAYVRARFREALDSSGRPKKLSFEESWRLIGEMPLIDLEHNETVKVSSLNFAG
ncbi:MAG: NADH dehydrogenase [Lentisphaerae bacterium RIFOXYA12_FULL_48_11]|nr:MAG: NADH dehydrogenase [Lentisphaerae bacterium RIFOXYA12_FULL_48_11]